MGFIDMHGGLGRRFGSIGLALDQPATVLEAQSAKAFSAQGPEAERVVEAAAGFAQKAGLAGGAEFFVEGAIPAHSGLGSGTQLSLAVGVALSRLYGLGLSVREVAALTARGARSGIGIGAFEQGGLLVDGGRSPATVVPPIISRLAFPDAWRILLVFDPAAEGVHGPAEFKAFGELPEFPACRAAHIAHLVLMLALPAVAECDLSAFGKAISEVQHIVGEHFAPAQGGGIYISNRVGRVMAWLEGQGVTCLGQSSWGPTGFAVVADEAAADDLVTKLKTQAPEVRVMVCRARNQGCLVTGNGMAA